MVTAGDGGYWWLWWWWLVVVTAGGGSRGWGLVVVADCGGKWRLWSWRDLPLVVAMVVVGDACRVVAAG